MADSKYTYDRGLDFHPVMEYHPNWRYFMGRVMSQATKDRIAASKRGRKRGPLPDEWRGKIAASLRGKPHSEEHRDNIAASLRGKSHPHRGGPPCARVLQSGWTHTDATRAKMSESASARVLRGHFGKIKGHYTPKKVSNRAVQHYRSSLELRFMQTLDSDPDVLSWEYESFRVPYGTHYTIPDFLVHRRGGSVVVEAKARGLVPSFLQEDRYFAALAWADGQGIPFLILTEDGFLRG